MEPYVHDAVLDMRMSRDGLTTALDALSPADFERYVPYGHRTIRDLVAHLATADHAWALAAQGLLKGEADQRPPLSPDEARAIRDEAIERRRTSSFAELRAEMDRRRKLLLTLFDLLEPKHLAMRLPSFGEHNSVRERIWLGYHDRLHEGDIERALRMAWHPKPLTFLPDLGETIGALAPEDTLYVVYSIDPTYWERPSPLAGWSFRNLLAHIATGDWVLQTHLRALLERGQPAPWPDVAAGNAERIESRKFTTWQRLTDEYLSSRHETMLLLASLKEEHLRAPIELRWEPPERRAATVLDYLTRFPAHDRTHREQLRAAMKHLTSARA